VWWVSDVVADEIVIDLIKKKIAELDQQQKNAVIEGFPRTKVQAMALQKIGVIPDQIFYLQCDEDTSLTRLQESGSVLQNRPADDMKEAAQRSYQ
jgi:adenylate kinase family enzyme